MSLPHLTNTDVVPDEPLSPEEIVRQAKRRRIFRRVVFILTTLVVLISVVGFFTARHWLNQALHDSLPQLDGSISLPGLAAPVTVQRDAHGVPHIRAASLDDLLFAQGFVTAQDRLWQMDALRRHGAGTLAEILGSSLLAHDRLQRTLELRNSADHALTTLAPDQLHQLERYAAGVNASIEVQRGHLPLEFRILRYQPAPWTPRDTILVGLVMFQDLTTSFSSELNREALTAKLPAHLVGDLYPVMSWRDHPPMQPVVDLTTPQQDIPNVPLDESQTKLNTTSLPAATSQDLLSLQETLRNPVCDGCFAGSNNWVVSGAHTATGRPLLSNDMHLAHNVPGIWYQADLESPTPSGDLHVTGVSLPGAPFIIVGHNEHVAWGFTNLGATVQDVYIEHIRGTGATAQYEAQSGVWKPLLYDHEVIHVKGGKDVVLDIPGTQHGTTVTPIISGVLPSEKRALSLRWTIYDPETINNLSFLPINAAADGASLVSAFSNFGGPSQNLVYADDHGHIGYHAIGRIPLRGSVMTPSPISPVPTDALDTTQEWIGAIPYDRLPQAVDPLNGILATANARVTPDDYAYPITINWGAPYRNQRIWKVLTEKAVATKNQLTPADMLALQTDIYSDLDHVIAERLAYAIDHATRPELSGDKRLHQAADLLRAWNGSVDANATAPAIVVAARAALWPLLINSQVGAQPNPTQTESGTKSDKAQPLPASALYTWGNKAYAEEWLIMHTPSRWLPKNYATWDDLLATAVAQSLRISKAPADLSKWQYGQFHPVEINHPIYGESPLLQRLIDLPTGTGIQPQSGDDATVKQVGRSFGPSERFTAELADLDHSTLNLVLGESSNPASPWFMDQWHAWYNGTTFPLPFSHAAVDAATTHTLTLTPH
jgi:penicillin G amidase